MRRSGPDDRASRALARLGTRGVTSAHMSLATEASSFGEDEKNRGSTMLEGRRPLVRSCALALVAAMGVLVGISAAACDDAYEAPCRVVQQRAIVEEARVGMRPAIALRRSLGGATAVWEWRDLLDAGTDGGDAAATLALAGFEIVTMNERADVVRRRSISAPKELSERRTGVVDLGVLVVDDAPLVHWTETTVTTDADGRRRLSARLRASYFEETTALPPLDMASCERCSMTVASVAMKDEAIAFVRVSPDHEGALDAAPPSLRALRLSRDGAWEDVPMPWLVLPSPDGGVEGESTDGLGPVLSAFLAAEDRVSLAVSNLAWLVDSELRREAGPVELPRAPDVRLAWESASGDVSVVWSTSPYEDGRASGELVPRDIFFGLAPLWTTSVEVRDRVTRGRATLALDRRGEDLGVLFESASRTLFASVDSRGAKRGGDVVVFPASRARASEYGYVEVPHAHLVFAHGEGRFTAMRLGEGALVATEILCAP